MRSWSNAHCRNANAPFPLIKALCPSWDNDCRRQGAGFTLHGSSPRLYARWLDGLIEHARANPFRGEPFIFVNAWNEWAEAAYLEPDVYYGAAYLNATARALVGQDRRAAKPTILLVGHDAHRHGAQFILLHLGRRPHSSVRGEGHLASLQGWAVDRQVSRRGAGDDRTSQDRGSSPNCLTRCVLTA